MALNYDYLAGLVDGEGSFIVTLSPRKRKTGIISVGLYMWFSIGLSNEGVGLVHRLAKWLAQDGIKAYVKENKRQAQLRIVKIDSLKMLCDRLNGKLVIKQDILKNFELILRLRIQHKSDYPHKFKKAWTEELVDYHRTVAVIWDSIRKSRNRTPHFYENKLFSMLDRKGVL